MSGVSAMGCDGFCSQIVRTPGWDVLSGMISALAGLASVKTCLSSPPWGDLLFQGDRKSTRLNSSHQIISYAVFCLKKKIYYKRLFLRAKRPRKIHYGT